MLAADRDQAPIADHELDSLFSGLSKFNKIVVAVSGGPDSMALLHLLHRWSRQISEPQLIAATVDHGLRPEAKLEARLVKSFAVKLDVEHKTLDWSGDKPETGIQEAARDIRYSLLVYLAKEESAGAIVTAHTRDDQSETFLMRLARGSGLAGLAGIHRVSQRSGVTLVRPFLDVPKSRLIATLNAAGIAFAEDPSNKDPRFTRVRMREITRALASEGIDSARIAGVAARLARADAAIAAMMEEVWKTLTGGRPVGVAFNGMDASLLFGQPEEISLRLLGRCVDLAGNEGSVELAKLESLHSALKEAYQAEIPLKRTLAGAALRLDGGMLVVERAPPRSGRLPKA